MDRHLKGDAEPEASEVVLSGVQGPKLPKISIPIFILVREV